MNLELFYTPFCPFCQKVLRFIDANKITGITLKDKSANPKFEKELSELGGKIQVPCLIIDGKAMYESDDIISWLEENR